MNVTVPDIRRMWRKMLALIALLATAIHISASAASDDASPVISATVTSVESNHGWAINYPKQRKLFVMKDQLWVFFSDGKDAVYCTSADGARWTDPTVFVPGINFGHRFGCWFDGAYFHYAHCTANLGEDVWYRRGKPTHEGMIEWCAEAQLAYDTPAEKNVMYPKMIVDSYGHPWITFMQLTYKVPNTPPYDAIVIKSSSNDGTWSTSPEFPFKLVDQKPVAGYPDPVGVSMTAGKTCWIYNTYEGGKNIYAARVWDGGAWQRQETIASKASEYAFFNAIAESDTVHLVHGAGEIFYQRRDVSDQWSDNISLAGGASGHTSISVLGREHVRVTWLDTQRNFVYHRDVEAGELGPTINWINETSHGLAGGGINLNTTLRSGQGIAHGVVYTIGEGPEFILKSAVENFILEEK